MSENSNDSAPERRATHIEPEQPSAVVPPLVPPAGWYPDPHDGSGQRYWDGAQWTEYVVVPAATSAAETAPAVTIGAAGAAGSAGAPGAPAKAAMADGGVLVSAKRGLPKLKWWQWALMAVGVLVLISIIVNGARGEREERADVPVSTVESAEAPVAEPEPVDDREAMPGLVGLTVAEARTAAEAAGFVIAMPADAADDWLVLTQTISEGRLADPGTEVFVTTEAPKPVYTLAQQNAIGTAQDYLDYSGFSRGRLIGQLEYEGFSTEDATFGADNAGADWNAEAAETAKSYLDYSSFSRDGLYRQLEYEEFTPEQIAFGLAAVGY